MPLYMDVHYVPDASEEDLAKAHLAHTIQELCAGKGFKFRELDEVSFKGFDETTKIGSVVWQNQ